MRRGVASAFAAAALVFAANLGAVLLSSTNGSYRP
jgi:hypothetical protein